MNLSKFESRSSLNKAVLLQYENNTDFRIKGVNYFECPDCGKKVVVASGFNTTSEDIHTKEVTDLTVQ